MCGDWDPIWGWGPLHGEWDPLYESEDLPVGLRTLAWKLGPHMGLRTFLWGWRLLHGELGPLYEAGDLRVGLETLAVGLRTFVWG